MQLTPELEEILAQCCLSTKVFGRTVFPDRFFRPFPAISDKIFAAIDDPKIQKVVIAAPRGWGKTSTVNMALPAKHILFRTKKFIVPISCTATQAITQGENLKNKLVTSSLVQKLFGPMKSDTFAKDYWKTSTGTLVLPRGAGQQVRGILADDSRPDLIIVDDLEDSESVKSEEQRAKLKEWFFSDVVNIVDRGSKDWKIVVIGTVLHEDSLLVNLLNDPDWFSLKIELCDDNYNSFWPDYMSNEDIKDLAESYAEKGLLHLFHMEYRNTVISPDAPFQTKYFKYYSETEDLLTKNLDVENFVIVDPAKTTNMQSAYSAIVGVGVDLKTNAIYIRDVINERLHPDELYDQTFEMCTRLRARVLGVETTGLNEFISYPFKTWITKNNLGIEFVELSARGGRRAQSKEDRIRALVPFYRRGMIFHNRNVTGPLEAQLLSFPRSKFWDVMDCTAYLVEMLEQGERYFLPSSDDPLPFEDDYDYEMSDINWRRI